MRLKDLVKIAFLAKSNDEKIEINNLISDKIDFSLNHVYQIEELYFVTSEIDKDFNKNAFFFYQANTDRAEAVSINDCQEYFARTWILNRIVDCICKYDCIDIFRNYFNFEPFLTARISHDLGKFYTIDELKDYLTKN